MVSQRERRKTLFISTSFTVVEDSTKREEKGRESEEEEDRRRRRRLPLPPFLSPFFWEEDVLDDERERERTLIEILTPHD